MLKSYSAARSILIQEVARYRGISPPSLVGDRSRDAGGRMKRRKEGEETWRELSTVRYQAKAHTSASSANLIPLTMCTRRNLLTFPFLPSFLPWRCSSSLFLVRPPVKLMANRDEEGKLCVCSPHPSLDV